MSDTTKIQWAGRTWNPVTGCTKVSPECTNCYAERQALRLQRMGQERYADGFAVTLHPEELARPARWKRTGRVFVVSMGDLFHPAVPTTYIEAVFRAMAEAPEQTFLVLTKRPELFRGLPRPALPNVWGGVTVGIRDTAERVNRLITADFVCRWISCEPLLDSIYGWGIETLLPWIDWAVIGGESGQSARPCYVRWVVDALELFQNAGIPTFVKQLGSKPRLDQLTTMGPKRWSNFHPNELAARRLNWPKGVTFNQILSGPAEGHWRINLEHTKGGEPDEWPPALRVRKYPDGAR